MNRENKIFDAIEYESLDVLEEVPHKSRGRWVYHVLKIAIGVLLYKVIFAAVPYLNHLMD